jgi:hypothetical protein
LHVTDASAAKRKPRRGHHGADAAAAVADARPERSSVLPGPAPTGSGLRCYYGKEVDGHTGQERCLSPEELDPPLQVVVDTSAHGGGAPSLHAPELQADASVTSASDAAAEEEDDAGDEGGTSGDFKARVVSVSFENGVVGRAHGSLKKLSTKMAECVATEGGLKVQSARLKLMFLVRSRGRAEGMIVASARNVPPKVVRCITRAVEAHPIGTPSNEPVGVTALIELKRREP